MSAPAVIYLCIGFLGLGIIAVKDGQPSKYSFGTSLLSWGGITCPLLYWGGFFS